MQTWQERAGNAIRRWREAAGYSKTELARKLEIHPSNVTRWESGEEPPALRWVQAIAEITGAGRFEIVLACLPDKARAFRDFLEDSARAAQ